jgi:hypothetical protein
MARAASKAALAPRTSILDKLRAAPADALPLKPLGEIEESDRLLTQLRSDLQRTAEEDFTLLDDHVHDKARVFFVMMQPLTKTHAKRDPADSGEGDRIVLEFRARRAAWCGLRFPCEGSAVFHSFNNSNSS